MPAIKISNVITAVMVVDTTGTFDPDNVVVPNGILTIDTASPGDYRIGNGTDTYANLAVADELEVSDVSGLADILDSLNTKDNESVYNKNQSGTGPEIEAVGGILDIPLNEANHFTVLSINEPVVINDLPEITEDTWTSFSIDFVSIGTSGTIAVPSNWMPLCTIPDMSEGRWFMSCFVLSHDQSVVYTFNKVQA